MLALMRVSFWMLRFFFWTANGESVPDPLHIRHVVCCDVLQVLYEGEKVRVCDLDPAP